MKFKSMPESRESIDLELLRHRLSYNPETGEFHWANPPRGVLKGSKAGVVDRGSGYIKIGFCGRTYPAHRLAWFYMHGCWPEVIDHVDRDRSNNRISNLRDCDHFGNAWNVPAHAKNSSGVKGVYWNKASGKWHAQVMVSKKKYSLGFFKSIQEAKAAYDNFCKTQHGEFFYENAKEARVGL